MTKKPNKMQQKYIQYCTMYACYEPSTISPHTLLESEYDFILVALAAYCSQNKQLWNPRNFAAKYMDFIEQFEELEEGK